MKYSNNRYQNKGAKMESNLIRLTGLWVNKSADGTTFMSGTLGSAKVMLFKNKNKRPNSNDPDYNLCMAPSENKGKAKEVVDETEDDLPF